MRHSCISRCIICITPVQMLQKKNKKSRKSQLCLQLAAKLVPAAELEDKPYKKVVTTYHVCDRIHPCAVWVVLRTKPTAIAWTHFLVLATGWVDDTLAHMHTPTPTYACMIIYCMYAGI